ncbi:hypothetical protein CTAYLR_006928 [Chrysophaeum taylorii]|uniref:Uncharacterized protein n=1 Tax=Chrysophaeum taylorii TaxID=2483200 RepID=A0AAD7UBH0_9STRA|nr:hypothetical protein CTAYLR_006928 [Chrysophaeum taylorii]
MKKISFDEKTIAEHDKERGTRMKIEEPETPFLYYNPATDSATDLEAVAAKLNNGSELPKAVQMAQEMDEETKKAQDFAEKRKGHYDEVARLKEWRKQHPTTNEEEEEDDDLSHK